ncbi:hypothetical protein [Streptomyces sp. H39-C1]|uniref:hypothetical protein n=1 Tax=Streptomyces sp. H39-C1 TaxID=3004355 RepID=UPI0022AEF9D5|nr:hypothetical protein [Streptomyces sp. H39-C1]MCZ4099864.1 hypothetical protein [Streptomyces sp. H39-C1]
MTTWKERHDDAVARQEQAMRAYVAATADRARALQEGEAELGSQAAVGRELGVTRAIVNRAIKALDKKDPS